MSNEPYENRPPGVRITTDAKVAQIARAYDIPPHDQWSHPMDEARWVAILDLLARVREDGERIERLRAEVESFERQVRRVVMICIDSRAQPPERQAPMLRDCILSELDPVMNITQRIREEAQEQRKGASR